MMKPTFSIDEASFLEEWATLEGDAPIKVARMLELTGIEAVAFLRSLGAEMRPPRNPGEGPRRAHPGGWADVTGNLANAYSSEVVANNGVRLAWVPAGPTTGTEAAPVSAAPAIGMGGGLPPSLRSSSITLWLTNTMEYAAALEAKDGYYVVSGIAEQGGPLDAALRRAAARLGGDIELGAA